MDKKFNNSMLFVHCQNKNKTCSLHSMCNNIKF